MIYTYEDARKIEGYVEGKYRHNLLLLMKYIDPNNVAEFDNWVMVDANCEVSQKGKCVCSHHILYTFQAEHIETYDRMELGSDCITLFDKTYKKDTSNIIRKIKNPDIEFCFSCKRKVQTQYEDNDNIYCKKCFQELTFNCEWCSETPLNKYKKSHMRTHKKEIYDNELVNCSYCNKKPKRKDLKKHIEAKHKAETYILTWGKYKYSSLLEIKKKNKGYLKWLSDNAYSSTVREYSNYILNK